MCDASSKEVLRAEARKREMLPDEAAKQAAWREEGDQKATEVRNGP
jgi:hypothetical protein